MKLNDFERINLEKVPLGSSVCDKVTGFTGTACQMCFYLSGAVQVGVQPLGDGKTYPDAMFVDIQTIEVLTPHLSHLAVKELDYDVPLGGVLRDRVSGFTGVSIAKAYMLNGCVSHQLQPKVKEGDEGLLPEGPWFNHSRLILAEDVEELTQGLQTGGASVRLPGNKANNRGVL